MSWKRAPWVVVGVFLAVLCVALWDALVNKSPDAWTGVLGCTFGALLWGGIGWDVRHD